MSKLMNGLIWLCLAMYPLLVYVGISSFSATAVGFGLCVIFLLRLVLSFYQPQAMANQRYLGLIGMVLVALFFLRQDPQILHLYPVIVNASLLALFGFSLRQEMPIIERFARLRHPDLSLNARSYFKNLTLIWCAFFVINGSIAAWTVYLEDAQLWALYNGFISYLLMGALAVGEFAYRKLTKLEDKYG